MRIGIVFAGQGAQYSGMGKDLYDSCLLYTSGEFQLREAQVKQTVELIDEGNTIPFIARYRKEATGGLSDVVLRDMDERLTYLRNRCV